MKTIKLYSIAGAITLAILIAQTPACVAQNKGQAKEMLKNSTPEQRAEMQNKLMKQELNLTDQQYDDLSKLNLEYAKKMQTIIDSDDSRMSKARAARSMKGEKEQKLKAILSKEQFEKYEEYVKSKMQQLKNNRNG